jgi:hypothetical protein
MEKKLKTLQEKMKKDLQMEREKHRIQLQNIKVRSPMHMQMCTTLHSFIPVLYSCPQTPYPELISCILGTIILIILYLNYQKLH